MEVRIRERDDVVIAALQGKLAAGIGDQTLRALIDDLLAEDRKKILLDLSEVSAIDSSGVGELVAGLRVARELGSDVRILHVPDRVEHVLDMAQLLPLFQIYRDEDDAIAQFGGGDDGSDGNYGS